MKHASLLVGLLAVACVPVANAVDLNKEALKSMQEEGHKLLEESQGGRAYRSGGGLCLDTAGAKLVVKPCNDGASQQWSLQEGGHLMAHTGQCVNDSSLAKCGSGPVQSWKHDGRQRLSNGKNQCLQVQGTPAKAGASVVTARCNKSASQVWK